MMMLSQTPIQTAKELGLMQGFPPANAVTHANQLIAPHNRWAFQHELPLNHVVDVWRGDGGSAPLERELRDLSQVFYHNRAGTQFSFEDMLNLSYTDGVVILHKGKIIFERYLNDMPAHALHAWASGSKSLTGTLATLLVEKHILDADATVAVYLPELKTSGFGDATLRQVMDMTTAVHFAEDDADLVTENRNYGIALGWQARPADHTGPVSVYDFLPTMRKSGEHGEKFTYLTPNTDVLAWIMKRVLNQSLAEIMHEHIWAKLGAERDAFWIVDPSTAETAGSGLLTTVRDMARFGQMLLQEGWFNGQQILPAAAVKQITIGADPQVFARGPAAGPTNQGWSYRNQWWLTHNAWGAYQAMGYGGQLLYIAPGAQLVIARFCSYPTPTPAGNEFYSAMAAFPALCKALS
jgi:CubicO group peptidase (beta-lactamase class C family)